MSAPQQLTAEEARILRLSLPSAKVFEVSAREELVVLQLVARGLISYRADSKHRVLYDATEAGLRALTAHDLDGKIDPLRDVFRTTKKTLEALPDSRMRSLAISALEVSYSRAIFAVSEIHDPIGSD